MSAYGGGPKWKTPPDMHGQWAAAWRQRCYERTDDPRMQATVDSWLVRSPMSHPFWWWYAVYLVHLRPAEGLGPPKLGFPEATHELGVIALNPGHKVPDPANTPPDSLCYLTPMDHCWQMQAESDEHARSVAEMFVRSAVEEGISLDQDLRRYWFDRLLALGIRVERRI